MILCVFGCGEEGKFQQKNGKFCCSSHSTKCLAIKNKIGSKNAISNKGNKHSNETKEKMSHAQKGRIVSEETKEKIREGNIRTKSNQTIIPWNKGKKTNQIPWNKGYRKRKFNVIDGEDVAYKNFKKYRNRVAVRTKKTYEMFKEEINPNNFMIGKCGIDGAYQIDHIISVREGFDKGLSIEMISSKENLQVIPWLENIKKYDGTRSK